MSQTISHHERVPSEFIGKARQFRNAVTTACKGLNEHLKAATRPVHARLLRNPHNPSVTQAHLDKLRQALEKVSGCQIPPRPYRLRRQPQEVQLPVVSATRRLLVAYDWSENEDGLLITRITIACDGANLFEQDVTDHAVAGLHSIGRWFQRSFTQDIDDLLIDLKPLAYAAPSDVRVAYVAMVTGGVRDLLMAVTSAAYW